MYFKSRRCEPSPDIPCCREGGKGGLGPTQVSHRVIEPLLPRARFPRRRKAIEIPGIDPGPAVAGEVFKGVGGICPPEIQRESPVGEVSAVAAGEWVGPAREERTEHGSQLGPVTERATHILGPERRSLEPQIMQRRARPPVCEPLGQCQAKIQSGTHTDLPDHKGLISGLCRPTL